VKEPSVLIIIVTFNKKEYVVNLLKSLREIEYKNHDDIVIDNASTDGTAEYLKEHFPSVTVIRNNENRGGSGGFNTGLSYAFEREKYKYYWLLDNDVVVSKDALGKLVKTLDENSDIAIAGSQMCQLDNPEVTNEIGAYVDFRKGHLVLNRHVTRKKNNSTGIFDVDYIAAASLLVRADVAKNAGLWEDFFIHFDDVDWCLRIKKMGYRVVGVAESVIWHLSAAEKPITWQQYYDVRNMLFLLDKHATKEYAIPFR
jgi:GT2 family glycosyltransferase